NDGIADGARRGERARVIALREHCSPAPQYAVDGAGKPNCEPLHAARERAGIVRFHKQVHVIRLHGKVDDAVPFARGAREAAAQDGERGLAERWQLGSDAQRDVRGVRLPVLGTAAMRNRGATAGRSARPGTPAAAAPALEKVQLLIALTAGFPTLL